MRDPYDETEYEDDTPQPPEKKSNPPPKPSSRLGFTNKKPRPRAPGQGQHTAT